MSNGEHFKLSRIGKRPIAIPSGVQVVIDGRHVKVKGPKGHLERKFTDHVKVVEKQGSLHVELEREDSEGRAFQGMVRSLLANMVHGVSEGYERKLEIVGVGYRADQKNARELVFNIGYSHPILYELPEGVSSEVTKDNKVILRSTDKALVGEAAAKIRSFRKPEPYKGKGIKYAEEVIIHKAGKTSAK